MACVLVLIVKSVQDSMETADKDFWRHHVQEIALEEKGEKGEL